MIRIDLPPRVDWTQRVEEFGLVYHTHQGQPYWYEAAAYALNPRDVQKLEDATNQLHALCLKAVEVIVQRGYDPRFGLTATAFTRACDSWRAKHPHLYGRFDLAYDGHGEPKMLEYNADTPTALLEAAVIQWQWLQAMNPGADQFNSIWEALIARYKNLFPNRDERIYFAHADEPEDIMTVSLLEDAARAAGQPTGSILLGDIGWNESKNCFVDLQERPIRRCFKLYPWEAMSRDKFGELAMADDKLGMWIEPLWKVFLSSKAILPILWEMNPGHPNLLNASFEPISGDYVKKPVFSREGAGVSIFADGELKESTPEEESHKSFIYQAKAELFRSSGGHAVIGSWVVGDESCGVGIRESDGLITRDTSRFVPHWIAAPG